MKLAKVVGTVVLSQCIESFRGQTLHIIQDVDEELELTGEAEVSATWQAMIAALGRRCALPLAVLCTDSTRVI